jgi:hypothetical protein
MYHIPKSCQLIPKCPAELSHIHLPQYYGNNVA